jgi:choice-of-anchor B domain-containing protein
MFVVSEAAGHGLQVFDLTQLRGLTGPPVDFTASAHYDDFHHAHTLALNETTGFAYAVGSETCGQGLHMVDVRNPASPAFAGCYSADGYTHDVQCVAYAGPDARYRGREICFASNEDTLTIVDVTDKSAPALLSRTGYAGRGFTHQGWLTEDHRYFLLDDETDEIAFGHGTRTYVWDLSLLDAPKAPWTYTAATSATDHNQYVRGRYVYQANYRAGLRILDLIDIGSRNLTEVGFFDTYPTGDTPGTVGAWNNYPFFPSGVVLVSGINEGLFVLRPAIPPEPLRFYTVTPCRVADTRDLAGPFGGPPLAAGQDRGFAIGGRCGVPATARAAALNVTVAGPSAQGHLRIYPGSVLPFASAINYRAGQVRANNAIVGLSGGGGLTVRADQAAGSVHVLIDVTGYFQ